MFNKKFCILAIFFIALLSISVVSAEDSTDSVLTVDDSPILEDSIEEAAVLDESVENIETSDENPDPVAIEDTDEVDLDSNEIETIESVDADTKDVADEIMSNKEPKNTLKSSYDDSPYNYYVDPLTTYYVSGKHIYFGWQGYFSGYFKILNSKGSVVYSEYLSGYDDDRKYCINALAAGTYYAGLVDDYYGLLDYSKVVIKKATSKISVKSFKTTVGKKVTCRAYVRDKNDGAKIDGGYVKFRIAGKTYKAKLKNGVAKITFKAPKKIKKYTCKAYYPAGKNIKASSKKFKMVVKKKTKAKKLAKGQYMDWCHVVEHNHKAVWTKKYYGKSYDGLVKINGVYYKRYVKLYQLDCKCYKKKYHAKWLKAHGQKYYSYQTSTATNSPKYVYKKAKFKTVTLGTKYNNYVSKNSGKYKIETYKWKGYTIGGLEIYLYKNGKMVPSSQFSSKAFYNADGTWRWGTWSHASQGYTNYHHYSLGNDVKVSKVKVRFII